MTYNFELKDTSNSIFGDARSIVKYIMYHWRQQDIAPESFTVSVLIDGLEVNTLNGREFLTHSAFDKK